MNVIFKVFCFIWCRLLLGFFFYYCIHNGYSKIYIIIIIMIILKHVFQLMNIHSQTSTAQTHLPSSNNIHSRDRNEKNKNEYQKVIWMMMKKKITQTEVSFKLNLSFIIIPFRLLSSFQPWRLSKIQRLKNKLFKISLRMR